MSAIQNGTDHFESNGHAGPSSLKADAKVMERLARDFPDAGSLSRYSQMHARLQVEILDIKEEIAVLQVELRRDQDPGKMSKIQDMIGQLMLQINVIREKAAEAEAIVKSITSDIQRLDTAKRNLTGAVKTLEMWAMLQQAHQQLKGLLPTKKYKEMSQALSAITHLSNPLIPMKTIPVIAELFRSAQQDRNLLQEKVGEEMDIFFKKDPNQAQDPRLVSEACLVIDVLGGDYKNHIVERYLQVELAEYRRIFRSSDEAGQLDNVPRRYAWFRRVIKQHDEEHASLFPPSWEVTRLLVASFAESTRSDLANLLGKGVPNVTVLLEALQATVDFENFFSKRFELPFDEVTIGGTQSQTSSTKWTISSIFDTHFEIYVDAQDRGSRSRSSMEGVIQLESDTPGPTVLPSSTELFYFYAQTLEQCGKYTNGEPMRRLGKIFGKWLKIYADEVLLAGMKKAEFGRRSVEGRFNTQEVKSSCMILNTAEYCLNTSRQLEERLREKIAPEFKEAVSYEAERDHFTSLMSVCVTNLLREVEAACEPAFAAILKTPWMHLENVSGRSAYIVDLVGSIKQVAELVRERVESKKYIRNFSDKTVGLIIARFTQAVIKSRPLRKIGAEQVSLALTPSLYQILLDVQAVKACLLDLPEPHPDNSTNSYTKYVTKNTGQLETMLKVILAPDDPPEGFVQNYCLLIGDRSFSNFQKILDLKGTLKTDQQRLLDIFLSVTSTNDELSDTSFLTSLDMETSADKMITSPTSSALFSPTNSGAGVLPSLLSRNGSVDGFEGRSETPKAFGDFRRLVSFARGRD